MRRQLRHIGRYIILNGLMIAMISCQQAEPTLIEGKAYVTATDGELNDTLRLCNCWQTKDSLNIHITRGPYMGISIDLTGRNNYYQASVEYYSDTNEFNGQFNLKVPVANDSLSISFKSVGDSVRISGYVEVKSTSITFFGDGRIVEAFGTFNCTVARRN
jgi:hypothetical protein